MSLFEPALGRRTRFGVPAVLAIAVVAAGAAAALAGRGAAARAAGAAGSAPRELSPAPGVDLAALRRHGADVAAALARLGRPLTAPELEALRAAPDAASAQKLLDRHVLFALRVGPDRRVVSVEPGPAEPVLQEDGWRPFLVKIVNDARASLELRVESPQAAPVYRMHGFPGSESTAPLVSREDVAKRWANLELLREPPFGATLSGTAVEYRVLEVLCADRTLGAAVTAHEKAPVVPADAGPFEKTARIGFHAGPGTEDLLGRNWLERRFTCRPATPVKLRVRESGGEPATASFTISDARGRTYPLKPKRLAPDLFFHPQIYRADGEVLRLPPGRYQVQASRGPEYLATSRTLEVGEGPTEVEFVLERWVDPARAGWVSGDPHLHAAGCVHYDAPTEGVFPEDVFRQLLGEDVKVGAVLAWRPSYYFQKQFFGGRGVHPLSTSRNLLRYDLEVSGFSHHQAGHNVYLGLGDQDYPGAQVLEDWPHLTLPVIEWAKRQGAAVGVAHSGWGLEVEDQQVPSFELPKFDGIGANEYVALLPHQVRNAAGKLEPAIDFLSGVDTPHVWELSVWYHALNAGYRTRFAGESDFPCIVDDRVGMGRSYVHLGSGKLEFERWLEGLRTGRSYASDGRSHLLDFAVDGLGVGTRGSELRLARPKTVRITAKVAARLEEQPPASLKPSPDTPEPHWHLERARIPGTREVPLELVVNGEPIATRRIKADGRLQEVSFEVALGRSSWVALRILPSAHTNPVFVVIGGRPVRGDRRSVEWLARAVEVCWEQKRPTFRPEELEPAKRLYDGARDAYRHLLSGWPEPPGPRRER